MIQFNEQVKAIHISNILGKVAIKAHNENSILIQTTEEEKVDVACRGNKLLIQTKLSEQKGTQKNGIFRNVFGGVTITNTGSNSVIIQNGNVIVNGMASEDLATVDMIVFVPFGTLDTIDASGTIEVDIQAVSDNLTLDYSGQTISAIAGIERVNLDFSGQSNATILGAKQVDADLSGQSQLRIESENMSRFLLDASGMSNVLVKSEAIDEVDLDVSGMGQVVIHGKVGKKMVDRSAMAKIEFMG